LSPQNRNGPVSRNGVSRYNHAFFLKKERPIAQEIIPEITTVRNILIKKIQYNAQVDL